MNDIYDPKFVENLFDRMSNSYSRMNYITSFGFSERWRRQCVNSIKIEKGDTVVDLLTGMGECWKYIIRKGDASSELIGLDFSTEMINRAERNKARYKTSTIRLHNENVFQNSIPDNSANCIVSGFGLKTFNNQQLDQLAQEIYRILKPNGEFSLIDVSVPENKILRFFYMFYLTYVIPILGWLFLGNPETYKMLGVYTGRFQNSRKVFEIFQRRGFEIEYVKYFFGCATGVKGRKLISR